MNQPATPGERTRPRSFATSDLVWELQRDAGNAAVAGLLAPARNRTGAGKPAVPSGATVQRQDEDEPDPEAEFLEDLDSGMAKAKEYLEYIPTAVDYWKQYGGDAPAGLQAAAEGLAKISTRISEGVDKYSQITGKLKQALKIKRWAESVGEVAGATRDLDIQNKASRDRWIGSVDHLGKLTKPFVEAASDWLKGLAVGGELVASRAFIVLGALTAYAEIGWDGLKAGLKAVEAYTDRFGFEGTEMRKIEEAEHGRAARPAEPAGPGGWTSATERKAEDRAFRRRLAMEEKARKRRERLAPFVAKVDQARSRIADAKRLFDEKGFAKAYRRRRGGLVTKISREMRYGKQRLNLKDPGGKGSASIERGVGSRWWDQLISMDAPAEFDQVVGAWVTPVKERISLEEAQFEIDDFRRVQPTCPPFNDLYAEELRKFTTKETKALNAATEELNRASALGD